MTDTAPKTEKTAAAKGPVADDQDATVGTAPAKQPTARASADDAAPEKSSPAAKPKAT